MDKDIIDLGCGDTLTWHKDVVPDKSAVQAIKDILQMHYADVQYILEFDVTDNRLPQILEKIEGKKRLLSYWGVEQ